MSSGSKATTRTTRPTAIAASAPTPTSRTASSTSRWCASSFLPLRGLREGEGRSWTRQLLVDEVHAVLAPEDLLADHEGRCAEHAALEARIGLGNQLLADLRA